MIKTIGGGDYEAVGEEFLHHFIDVGGLTPDDHVLDVGCGVGRMARPLTGYLKSDARYEGFDIVADEIRWCTEHITARFPHFRFQVSDVYNTVYNPEGKTPASRYRFPFRDGEFSFVCFTSVFTHLVPEDLRNYLNEAARVLRSGGRLFGTFFLLNPESEDLLRAGKSTLDFRYSLPGCLTTDQEAPEAAVAFPEEAIVAMHREAGLDIHRPIQYGSWCGRTMFRSYQDIVVSVKR
jgi:SAM-dependent methyltransferase